VLAGTLLVALTGGRLPRPRDIAIALVVATLYGLSDDDQGELEIEILRFDDDYEVWHGAEL